MQGEDLHKKGWGRDEPLSLANHSAVETLTLQPSGRETKLAEPFVLYAEVRQSDSSSL